MKKRFKLLLFLIALMTWGVSQAQYCTPAYSTGCTYGDGLTSFQLGTINQSITCNASYNQFTATTALDLGGTYNVTMIAGYGSTYVTIWMDLNNNNVFDASEILLSGFNCSSTGVAYSASITIPASATTGVKKLRFRTNWLSATTDPCASLTYGNAGDFDVTLQVPSAPGVAGIGAPGNGATGVLLTTTLSWTAPTTGGAVTGYKLYFGTNNPPTNIVNGTDLGNVLSYTPAPLNSNTLYRWRIVPYNGAGDATGVPTWSFTTLAGFGTLQGYVTNCYGVPVSGATVAAVGSSTYTTTSAANGFYQFLNIPAATYTLGAQKTGYNSVSITNVVVSPNNVTSRDIVLPNPSIAVLPNPNNATLNPNEFLDNPFTVTNAACGTLTWASTITYGAGGNTWFTMPTNSGTVAPSSNVSVPALFNAAGLTAGTTRSATVNFTTSNPNVGSMSVPVNMVVAGEALNPVTNLQGVLTNQMTGTVHLTWECTPSNGFLYYQWRRVGSAASVTLNTYADDVLPAFGTYTYEVMAVYTNGNTSPAYITIEWPNPSVTWTPATLTATVWSQHYAWVPLQLSNVGDGTLSYTFPDYVDNMGDSPLAYCTAQATACDEYIGKVVFGTINNTTGCSYYADYTAQQTQIEKGATYPMTVTNGGNPYSSDYLYVWIDYNHDEVFDNATELTQLATLSGGASFSGNITVPTGALTGVTRMRVRMSYATSANACGSQTYGEVEDYSVYIKAPSFITEVVPASGVLGGGLQKLIQTKFSATGDYSPAGVYNSSLKMNTNDPAHLSVTIPAVMTVTVPGTLTGTVTDCVSGVGIPGVMVQAGSFSSVTNDDGEYSFQMDAGTYNVVFSQAGYQNVTVSGVVVASGATVTVNAQMCETPYAPTCASAAVNADDTECVVTWCVPAGPYELLYDDGSAENYAAWQLPGNINAVKFTPKGYPALVKGGKFYVGDGSFPAGGNFMGQGFAVEVYKADGPGGLPGTRLDSTAVTVNSYGWITVGGLNATITAGDFYLGMIQLSQSPNCVPIGVDQTIPKAYKSYSKNVTQNGNWVLSPYQDFMMHAIVSSPISGDDNMGIARTLVPGKVSGMISQYAAEALPGLEAMTAEVTAPEGYETDAVHHYKLWRLFGFNPNSPLPGTATYTLLNSNLTATTYTEGGTTWSGLAQGWYAYAVKAVYPNNDESEYVYTNSVPHKLFADVTINVQLVCGFVPAPGAKVTMTGLDYPYSVYTATTPASGSVFFDNVIKGHYEVKVQKAGYYLWVANFNITGNKTINVIMDDIRYVPRNLYVDDMTLVATWDEPLAINVEEHFEGGVFPPAGWQATTQGSTGWYATTDGSSAYFAIPSHTTYVVANDDEGGSSNNGCCDYLITPECDLTNAPSFVLSFQSFYTGAYGQMAYVEMSTDAGATWTPIYTCTPANGWVQVDVDLSAYSGANGLNSVWFTFHADDAGQWASGWAIDDVMIASGGVPVQGYGVFLDGTLVGETPDLTWTYDPFTINYGQTYVAGVAGKYCSGYSELCTYTFTSHFLFPPRNLQGVPNESAAILTWEAPLGGDFAVAGSIARTEMPNASVEYSPFVTQRSGSMDATPTWDVLLTFTGTTASQTGIATDGNYIYTANWNSTAFHKYDLNGAWIEDFTVPGAGEIRDFAYDGTHFYGVHNAASIYKMDLVNKVLVSTISTSASDLRHIAYDPTLDGNNGGFWSGGWSAERQYKMDGSLIQTVSAFNLSSCYASAFDNFTDGGPYIWYFDQGGNGLDIWQFHIPSMSFTGFVQDATTIPGTSGGIAGGMEYSTLLVTGHGALLCSSQQDPQFFFAYDMGAASGGGSGAANLLRYNLYRNDVMVAQIPKTELEYWDTGLAPAMYCYDITAVYDLTIYGFPGQEGESVKEGTACVPVYYGFNLPFMEDWTTGQFDVNFWTTGPNWVMDGQAGNPAPSAKFKWDPILNDYASSLESWYMNATTITTTTPYKIWMDYDLKLDDRTASTTEKLNVEVWNGLVWIKVKDYANNGDFDWTSEHVNISAPAKNHVFKVRFNANGTKTSDIFYWMVDNIHIYVGYEFNAPTNLIADRIGTPENDIKLTWNAPAGGGTVVNYVLDDGSFETGVYWNGAGEAWLGNMFNVVDAGVLQAAQIYLSANSSGTTYSVDIFDAGKNYVGTSGTFVPTLDDWTTVALPDLPFSGPFYVMVHLNSTVASDVFPLDSNGPNAASNPEWFFDGSAWDQLTSYGFPASVMAIRASALLGDKKTSVTFLPATPNQGSVSSNGSMLKGKDMTINTGNASSSLQYLGDNLEGMTGYNVYRNAYLQYPQAGANTSGTHTWVKIGSTPAAVTEYIDLNLSNLVTNCYEYYVTAVYDEGESEPSNTDYDCIFVGVNPGQVSEVKVYPNPAISYVNIDLTKEVRNITIYNALGSVVLEKVVTGESTVRINTTTYAAGAYSVKFTTVNGDSFSRKFVVTK